MGEKGRKLLNKILVLGVGYSYMVWWILQILEGKLLLLLYKCNVFVYFFILLVLYGLYVERGFFCLEYGYW